MTNNPTEQAAKLFDRYTAYIYDDRQEVKPLSEWLTEDLVRLYHLIDVELQERAFNAEFPAVTDNIEDEMGPARDEDFDY